MSRGDFRTLKFFSSPCQPYLFFLDCGRIKLSHLSVPCSGCGVAAAWFSPVEFLPRMVWVKHSSVTILTFC